MTPTEFLNEVVRPNEAAFKDQFDNLRLGLNCVWSVDALAAHIFWAAKDQLAEEFESWKDDSAFKTSLKREESSFGLVCDLANLQKHVRLVRYSPSVKKLHVRSIGFGELPYGRGRYGGPPQVIIIKNDQAEDYLESVLGEAIQFLEAKYLSDSKT